MFNDFVHRLIISEIRNSKSTIDHQTALFSNSLKQLYSHYLQKIIDFVLIKWDNNIKNINMLILLHFQNGFTIHWFNIR